MSETHTVLRLIMGADAGYFISSVKLDLLEIMDRRYNIREVYQVGFEK